MMDSRRFGRALAATQSFYRWSFLNSCYQLRLGSGKIKKKLGKYIYVNVAFSSEIAAILNSWRLQTFYEVL